MLSASSNTIFAERVMAASLRQLIDLTRNTCCSESIGDSRTKEYGSVAIEAREFRRFPRVVHFLCGLLAASGLKIGGATRAALTAWPGILTILAAPVNTAMKFRVLRVGRSLRNVSWTQLKVPMNSIDTGLDFPIEDGGKKVPGHEIYTRMCAMRRYQLGLLIALSLGNDRLSNVE